ncbi:MAG: hypothetical protein ACK5V3_12050, partial [Bdellovibrionales bacterium]
LKLNLFVTSRSLDEYIDGFFTGFKNSLDKLKPHEVWMDLGSGKGKAALEFLRSKRHMQDSPTVVLITYKSGRWLKWPQFSGKLKTFEGKLFEDIVESEMPKAQLITDFFGVLNYTLDLTLSLTKVFSHLEKGGELYLHSKHTHTMIETPQGKIMGLTEFLKSIPGLEVEGQFGILKVTKSADRIVVPELKLVKVDEAERPFFRRFALIQNR